MIDPHVSDTDLRECLRHGRPAAAGSHAPAQAMALSLATRLRAAEMPWRLDASGCTAAIGQFDECHLLLRSVLSRTSLTLELTMVAPGGVRDIGHWALVGLPPPPGQLQLPPPGGR